MRKPYLATLLKNPTLLIFLVTLHHPDHHNSSELITITVRQSKCSFWVILPLTRPRLSRHLPLRLHPDWPVSQQFPGHPGSSALRFRHLAEEDNLREEKNFTHTHLDTMWTCIDRTWTLREPWMDMRGQYLSTTWTDFGNYLAITWTILKYYADNTLTIRGHRSGTARTYFWTQFNSIQFKLICIALLTICIVTK